MRAALAAWLLDRAGPDRALLRAIEFGDGSGRALLGAVADEDGDRPAEQPPSGWPVSMAAGLAASIRRTTLCLVTPYGLLPSGAAIDYAEAQGWHYLDAASLDLLAGAVQLLWLEAGGPHPLAPLAHAWLRWQDTMPTERPPFAPATRGSLPRLGKLGTDDATLPDFPQADAPAQDGQLWLPEFSDAVRGCTSWLLWLFDRAGGKSMAAGRGAPWDLRLFAYALLHLAVADRDGQWHTIRLAASPEHAERIYGTTGNRPPNVEDWLHPNGWNNKRRDWHKLPDALDRMRRLAYVPVPGIGRVAMLFPSVIPSAPTDPLVEFTVRVPRSAAHGDRLNWPRLVKYGADSARMLRAYLSVVPWLGRSAHHGHPITRTIAAPVLGPDGKPARRKGGAIIRSATKRIVHPAVHLAGPPLSEDDLARMIGFDPTDRYRRRDARAAFECLEAAGVLEIERAGAGWLLFGGPNW